MVVSNKKGGPAVSHTEQGPAASTLVLFLPLNDERLGTV